MSIRTANRRNADELRFKRMIVILNRAAGASDANGIDEKIRSLFAAAGLEATIQHPDETRDLSSLARAAAEGADDIVVAGGGDGTISAVAGALAGTGKTLGVLPLGTLNHFAKDLGLPLELADAVETIARGKIAEVDVGEVNGRVFINNSSLGIYPRLVASREAQQERLGRGKWHAFFWAALRVFWRFPHLRLRVALEGRQIERRTPFLFIGNNEYEMEGLKLGGRACLNAGKLGLYLAHRAGRLGLLRLAFGALFGRLNQADEFDAYCVEEATIAARRKKSLLVATDGEVERMETPLCYRVRPRALRVLVPHPKERD